MALPAGRAEGARLPAQRNRHYARPLAMERLPSAGEGQSHRGHQSGRARGSWRPLLPGWGLGHSPAKEWRRPRQSSAAMATLVVLAFLFSTGVVQCDGGVPAGVTKGEGVHGGFHGRVKLHIPTTEADATYMRRLAAATGADRALNWSGDPCYTNWPGIDCDGDGRVVAINASTQGLRGWVPSTEGDGALSSLVELDLRGNELSGPLPELAVPQLETIYLDGNMFSSMPPGFFSNMSKVRIISISNCTVLRGWTLPDLRNFTALSNLQARGAGVVGELLGVLANVSALSDLDLANNRLTGPVPDTFASPAMRSLDLSNNSLNGEISFLQNLPGVPFIWLDNNNFSGQLPDFDEHDMPLVFSIAHNSLTGLVPVSLSFLSPGSLVRLAGNLLQGPVPVFADEVQTDVVEAARAGSFCRLDPGPCDQEVDALLSIAMALQFPVSLAESWRRNDPCAGWVGVHCTSDKGNGRRRVTGINLSRMFLNGTIHPAFANLQSLEMIALSGNNISGTIPPVLAKLPSLRVLDISDNNLNGTLPNFSRSVKVWAEGNPGLDISNASPPSLSEQRCTIGFVVMAVLLFRLPVGAVAFGVV